MTRRILIIPGSIDCNRGDQALVWTAIELIQSLFGNDVQIRLLTEADVPATDPACRQTVARGYHFNRMLLENPNRILDKEADNIHHTSKSFFLIVLRAVVDLLQSTVVLFFSGWPFFVRCFLGHEKRDTYARLCQADAVIVKGEDSFTPTMV